MGYAVLWSAFAAWFVAQLLKVVLPWMRSRSFNLKRFVESGGMPSSHTALVIGLTTSIGRHEGFDSTVFAVSLVFSLVVMYDASGVRQAAGKQAAILNRILLDLYHHQYHGNLLKEFLGHTPLEVWAGFLLGVVVGYFI